MLNQPMFDYIVQNTLYSLKGQTNASKVVFPCSDKKANRPGALMIKASWKILTAEERASGRFHVTQAVVYTPPSTNPPIDEKCEKAMAGLVGLHVVQKTSGSPQWIWSTFEHVDNCPTDGEAATSARYNFYNKATPDAPTNELVPRPWNPSVTEPPGRRSQVKRMLPISPATQQLNASYQAALRRVDPNSVWQYYQLVSTQWPTDAAKDCDVETSAPVNRTGTPAPQFLGNSTLETYIQGKVPNVSSSCMECHANATTVTSARAGNIPIFSDFTFLLERAQ